MSAEENKKSMRRIYEEVINQGDMDAADELISAALVEHDPLPGYEPSFEGFKEGVTAFRAAFPDLHATVEDIIAEGDMVAARFTMSGTHQEEFMGIPATGNRITVTGIDLARFEGARAWNTGPTRTTWACCSNSASSPRWSKPKLNQGFRTRTRQQVLSGSRTKSERRPTNVSERQ